MLLLLLNSGESSDNEQQTRPILRRAGNPKEELMLHNVDRRKFLHGATLTVAAWQLGAAGASAAQDKANIPPLIVRQKDPENLEFPFAALDRFIVPNDRFYVRNHFPAPRLDIKTWRLRVEGAVKRLIDLQYEELRKLKPATLTATLECSGNNRAFLVPKARGVA